MPCRSFAIKGERARRSDRRRHARRRAAEARCRQRCRRSRHLPRIPAPARRSRDPVALGSLRADLASRSGGCVGARSGSGRRAHAWHACGLRRGLVADEARWPSPTRRPSRSPTVSWRCTRMPIAGDRLPRWRAGSRSHTTPRGRPRSSIGSTWTCSPRPSSSAAGSSCRRSDGRSHCARRQALA